MTYRQKDERKLLLEFLAWLAREQPELNRPALVDQFLDARAKYQAWEQSQRRLEITG